MPVLGMQTRDIHGPAFHPKLAVKPSLMMMIILLSALGAEVWESGEVLAYTQ